MSYHDDDELNTTRDKYDALVNMFPFRAPITTTSAALDEALYTYSENHELRIEPELALLMWQIVEWARIATPDQVKEISL